MVLKGLMMRLHVWLSLLLLSCLQAEHFDEQLLSKEQKKSFYYDLSKNDAQSRKLRDSWLNPITASFSGTYKEQYGYAQESYNGSVRIDQPIFKSGGIYFGIKYANATALYNTLNIQSAKRRMIKDALSLMYELRKMDLNIKTLQLQYEDAKALYEYNMQQFLAGEMDRSQVNLNEINQNSLNISLLDLYNQKEALLYKLSLISDANYLELKLPHFSFVEKKRYLEHNIELRQLKAKYEQERYFKNMTISKYLPSVFATASYNYNKSVNQAFSENLLVGDTESQFFQYGFRISMPLFDINMLRDIQSAKVDYLKSSVTLSQKQKSHARFYEMTKAKIKRIDEKSALAKKNLALYKEVLAHTKASFESGDKSVLELNRAKHQSQIKALEIEKYYYEKQIELLNLYEKLYEF